MFKKFFIALVLICILSPLIMYLLWLVAAPQQLNVLILDKTVLETKTQEHLSLNWILTNGKYKHSVTGYYRHKIDYFGFFPNDSGKFSIRDFNRPGSEMIDSLVKLYEVAYYTDLYGIYRGEWLERYPNLNADSIARVDNSMERTQKIYGGMTEQELKLLTGMKVKHKTIVAEFNVIASPTPGNVRRGFENEFKMRWTGWVGRYYEVLDTTTNKELPRWMKRNYLAQHKNSWPFRNSGIVFVREDDRIEILENNSHLTTELPIIETNKRFQDKYDLPAQMKYPFWFDIINTDTTNSVVSSYRILPTQLGRKLLKRYGIPETFPAVIEHCKPDYRFYYFAGDFCDNPIGLKSAKFKYVEFLSSFFYQKMPQERISFFWDFYRPLVNHILVGDKSTN
jgi:hypothetical protein